MNNNEQIAMMIDKDEWPGDFLCMKRYRENVAFPDLGFLTKHTGSVLFFGNIFSITECYEIQNGKEEYSSYEAILNDGWEID